MEINDFDCNMLYNFTIEDNDDEIFEEAEKIQSLSSGLSSIQCASAFHSQHRVDLSCYTTWGNGLSVGRAACSLLRLPSQGLKKFGSYCETFSQEKVRNTGAVIRSLGAIIGMIANLTGQAITFVERCFLSSLQGLGGLTLIALGALPALAGRYCILDKGTTWLKNSWMTRGETQSEIPGNVIWYLEAYKQINYLRQAEFFAFYDYELPYDQEIIPENWRNNSTCVYDKSRKHLYSQRITVGDCNSIYVIKGLSSPATVSFTDNGKIFISFLGVDGPSSLGTAIASAFGVDDGTFQQAQSLVEGFEAMYPGQVHVLGHSLGGAIAQYAGIRTGIPVTCVNAMGLAARFVDELVWLNKKQRENFSNAQVVHFNSGTDWVAQKLQTRYLPLGLSQLGKRYKVHEADTHFIFSMIDGLKERMLKLQQASCLT